MKKAILFFLFFTIPFLYAETISLEEVRVLALANSRSLAQINMNIRSSELNEKSHLFTMLPSLSANYSASMDYLNNKWEFVNPIDTFNAGINMSLTQTIFNGGKNVIQKAINEISSESTRKDALAEYFRVLESADNAYYAVVESLLTLEAAQLSLESAVSALAIAEIRQASGMINLGDYLKAMADREAQENSRNQARRNLALNITKLKSLIKVDNLPDLEQIDLSFYETLIQYLGNISDGDFENLYNRLWNLIAASNPTLGKAALRTQSAQKSLSLAKRDSAPTLNATIVSGNFNYSTANGFDTSSGGKITLSGNIPIDFWVLSNKIERSKISLESSYLDYINSESELETTLQSFLINVITQAESVLSSRRSLEYAQKHYEYVEERYRLSQSSVSDLGDASSLLISNRNNNIKANFGFLQSLSQIRSLGAISDDVEFIALLLGIIS